MLSSELKMEIAAFFSFTMLIILSLVICTLSANLAVPSAPVPVASTVSNPQKSQLLQAVNASNNTLPQVSSEPLLIGSVPSQENDVSKIRNPASTDKKSQSNENNITESNVPPKKDSVSASVPLQDSSQYKNASDFTIATEVSSVSNVTSSPNVSVNQNLSVLADKKAGNSRFDEKVVSDSKDNVTDSAHILETNRTVPVINETLPIHADIANNTKISDQNQTSIEINNSTISETKVNGTVENNATTTTVEPTTPGEPVLPQKGAAEEERNSSISIFFVLCVLALGILLIHLMLSTHIQYLPESIAIVFLGAVIGLILNLMSDKNIANWRKEEAFSPTAFFLVLLPPIIFESGYNLHKGNFFQNIGSILVFAIIGTTISALVIGMGVYILGLAGIVYELNFVESFAFGSLISAVDPVATVAIFHALDIDPVLNMLVFGESILNDAVAIVLTTSILKSGGPEMSTSEAILTGINQFCLMFFASAGIGVVFALISALLLKYVDLRKNPSLEFGMMLVFTYAPYALAEGMHLSGIMAILFNGIVMSHYTHFNLSTVTQITMQQTMRTLAFIAETCVFAYLGLALFSFRHRFEPALVIWSVLLCLFGRACNIYPLAVLCNKFREHQITSRMMFIMWFSGLRGAISYALSLHLEFSDETRHVIITTTLIIVLVTTLVFGGSTMPLMKVLQGNNRKGNGKLRRKKRKEKALSLSKTKEWGQAIESEHLSEITEEELEGNFHQAQISGFAKLDIKYLTPFFTRRFTQQELKDCKTQMTDLTNQWYQAIRITPIESEEEKSYP